MPSMLWDSSHGLISKVLNLCLRYSLLVPIAFSNCEVVNWKLNWHLPRAEVIHYNYKTRTIYKLVVLYVFMAVVDRYDVFI